MRVAYFLTHPIQYQSPLIRTLRDGGADIEVIYATDVSTRSHLDSGFGKQVTWDVPLLEGYPYHVLNRSEPRGSKRSQIKHYTAHVARILDSGRYDAVWIHGWWHPLSTAAWNEAHKRRIPILLRGETFLGCVQGGPFRRWLHKSVYSHRLRTVAACLAVGTKNREFYRAYGVPEGNLFCVPYAVDNAFFQSRASEAEPNRDTLKASLGIEPERPILLFCGKLIGVKNPETLIRAVGGMVEQSAERRGRGENQPVNAALKPVLIVVGDGELRPSLEKLAAEVAPGCVKFLGFRNQTELPALYDLCDLFVLPSIFEPWGLVVNEVMNAGRPVLVSDRVGAAGDLVKQQLNGAIFPARDVVALTACLTEWLFDREKLQEAGKASLDIINRWSFQQCLVGLKSAMSYLERR